MPKLVARCPSCEGELFASRLHCKSCETQLEGQFEIPALLQLAPEDLVFITQFVRTSGSLKEMAELTKTSYPTVRNRLNDILERLTHIEKDVEKRRHDILDALESGKMTAKVAARELRKVGL